MKNRLYYLLPVFLSCMLMVSQPLLAQEKPRLWVFTDIGGDPDDQQSLVRLLIHAYHFDMEGFGTSSRLEHGEDTRPDIIQEQLDGYADVYPNLLQHRQDYLHPDTLRNRVFAGQGDRWKMGEGHDTEASNAFLSVLREPDPRPLWVIVWGGQRELAQALWKLKQTASEAEFNDLTGKLRVHSIGNQDGHMLWLLRNVPQMFHIISGFINMGYPTTDKVRLTSAYRGMYMTGPQELLSADWIEENIRQGHGALGKCYPLKTDVGNIKEGDTPSFLGMFQNGLNYPEHPEWGGWGGRFRPWVRGRFIDTPDYAFGSWNERHTVARWRETVQRDFAAHMDWCVKSFEEANHPPQSPLNEPVRMQVQPGQKVKVEAKAFSDPDGNTLTYRWWVYDEAGDYLGKVPVLKQKGLQATLQIPEDISGKTVHLILEATDSGSPKLTGYQRFMLKVE